HMTVSRVLNGHANIKESTRLKVLAAVEELGYRPNIAARALATQKTLRLGAIVETETELGPASALRAIHRAARLRGYSVSSIALDEEDSLDAGRAFEQLAGLGIDALCLVTPRSASVAALRALSPAMPVLVVTPERAFRARARSWGMPERPIVAGDWSADFGYDFAISLQRRPDYTAIFAANDQVALGLIHGLHDRGIRVPEDLSIVGFDDAAFSRHSIPPLTTVRQPFDALGSAVVDVLLAAI